MNGFDDFDLFETCEEYYNDDYYYYDAFDLETEDDYEFQCFSSAGQSNGLRNRR